MSRGDGTVYQRKDTGTWAIVYWVRGKRFHEAGGKTEAEARKRLKARQKEILAERFVGPREERITIDELLNSLVLHLRTKGAKSVAQYESTLKPIRAFFSLSRAVDVTTTKVERFIQERLQEGKAPATVNRETGALKQAFNLARKQGRLNRVPYVPSLKEDNARQGFFDRADVEALTAQLPDPIADVAWFAYLTGWRKGEILPLRWDAVDRSGREIRLHTSKNGTGRVLPLTGDLAALVERRWAAREYETADKVTALSEYVFHKRGRPVGDFKKSWVTACTKAKLGGRLFHDFRRTAARDMVRAGVPQSVAMAVTGHKTLSMFLRYNITSAEDIRRAIRQTEDYRTTQPTDRNVVGIHERNENVAESVG